jgi:hypothetical protein
LFYKIKVKRSQPAAAPTGPLSHAIKSPTKSSGGLARQAGKSVLAYLALGIRQKRSQFSPWFRQRSLLNTGCSELGRIF